MPLRRIHHHSKRNPLLSLAAVVSIAALIALATTNGATILAQARSIFLELESGSRTNVSQKSDSNASGGKYIQFSSGTDNTPAPDPDPEPEPEPGPDPEPEPGDGDWYGYTKPGPSNTGPTNGSILTNVTNSQLEDMMTEGAVIENVRITGGDVDVEADNVTIRNFVMNANGNRYGFVLRRSGKALTLEDGEIYNTSSSGILGMGFTARRLNIHDSSGDGIKPQNTAGAGGPVLIESSWIHRLGKGDGAHADSFQVRSGEFPIVVRGNNCDMPVNEKGGPGSPYKSNACFILQDGAEGPIVRVTAEYNWLNGGNYTVYCGDASSNHFFNYNRFGRQYRYGIRSGTCKGYTGNVWDDTGQVVPGS